MASGRPILKQLSICARWRPDRMMDILRKTTCSMASRHSMSLNCVRSRTYLHLCTSGTHVKHVKCGRVTAVIYLTCRRGLSDILSCKNACRDIRSPSTTLHNISSINFNTTYQRRRLCTAIFPVKCQPWSLTLDRTAACHSDSSHVKSSLDRASALFISDSVAQHTGSIPMSIDMEALLVDKFAELERSVQSRGVESKLDMPLRELVADYKTMKTLQAERDDLKAKRKPINNAILAIKEQNYDDQTATTMKEELLTQNRSLQQQYKKVTNVLWPIERRVMLSVLSLPNFLLPDTPEHDTVILATHSGSDEHDGVLCSHTDSAYQDIIRFSQVGMRSYYLCGEAAILEQELTTHVCNCLKNAGLTRISGSDYVRSAITEGCANDFADTQQVLTLELTEPKSHEMIESSYHLSGVGLETFAAYMAWSKIKTDGLPLMLFTAGRCYSASQLPVEDGLFSAMQTTNVEVFAAGRSLDECLSLAQKLQDLIWAMHKGLGLSIRLVDIPSDKLHRREMRRVELQAKTTSTQQFVTVGSVCVLGDYVSQRLTMTHSVYAKRTTDQHPLYIVHGCAANITRLVACCIENGMYNQETGCFVLPSSIPRSMSSIENASS